MESLLYLGLIHIMRGGQASIAAHTHHNNQVVPKTGEKKIIKHYQVSWYIIEHYQTFQDF